MLSPAIAGQNVHIVTEPAHSANNFDGAKQQLPSAWLIDNHDEGVLMATTWEDLIPGTVTGSIEFVVTDQMIDEYLDAMEFSHAWFTTGAAPYATRIAPTDLVAKLAMTDVFQNYIHRELGPNMRARQAFQFYAPIRAGAKVKATGRLTEKYEKRGKRFVTLEALFTDEKDNPLLLDKRTQYLLPPKTA